MKLFSDCAGRCLDCRTCYMSTCYAGHGDDEFVLIAPKEAREILLNRPDLSEEKKLHLVAIIAGKSYYEKKKLRLAAMMARAY